LKHLIPHTSPYRWLLLLAIVVAFIAILPMAQRAERQSQGPQRQQTKKQNVNAVPGEILVRFRPGSTGKRLGRQVVTEKTGRQISMSIEAVSPAFEIVEGLRVARVNPADTSNAIEALRARSDVLYAEPNFIRKASTLPNDPRFGDMWGLKNTGQRVSFGGHSGFAGNDIHAEQAWNITTGNRSVVVGVIDTGIDINHEDLKDNIWTNTAEVAGNGVDDDGNGFIDDVHGWDFAHNDANVFDYTEPTYPPAPSYTGDFDDHGTHVAGTIGATGNNAIGVVGVNWQVSVLPLKFLTGEAGAGESADFLKAMAYAKAMRQLWESSGGTKGANIRVLNGSFGGGGFSQAELDAIRSLGDAGILFVVAAGNEAVNNDLFPTYPTNYISPNLISVAASGGSGTRAFFSNFGEATVNVTAPGEYILSTTPKNTYDFANGTSMAAPHVSGTAALVCALSPSITMQKLRSIMMYSGYAAPWQFANTLPISTGRAVDASRALQSISDPDVTAPGAVTNLSVQFSGAFPTYTLNWQAPGDDNNGGGKVTAYEVRFSDTSLTKDNFDLAIPLPGPVPNDPGFFQSVTVRLPWRHASGFLGVRPVDDAGNRGPIASIPVSVNAEVSDPYTITETAAAPVSTGGTPLGLIGDDEFKTINLPFSFKFFDTEFSSISISTNGALYFIFPPDNDTISSERWVNGRRVIAGLWDDLRTDRRPGDDVYMVQDGDRVIFRWQAVTFDTPVSPTTTRGENPVSFEIELRFDGTITVRYGDGNQKTLPVVGIGGGSPEAYISTSHSSEGALKDLTNAATVVFARRKPVQRGVLTVASSNPSSGVNINVSPNDGAGLGAGTTQFTRAYNSGTTVTLTAPATVNGNKFQHWLRDGESWSGSLTTSVAMHSNLNFTMTAVYYTPPVLTVNSINPNSGVNISINPNDVNGAGNGTTPFTRTYDLNVQANLVAPATVGNSTFWKWQLDGVDFTPGQSIGIAMSKAYTLTAVYIAATPTPTPTPVPGAGAQPIAFVKPGNGGGNDIFLTNLDGTSVVNLTDTPGDDTRPGWSPDGSRLAYTCLRQPDGSIAPPQRICVRNADGTGFTVLSKSLQDEANPNWSRDGSQLALTISPGFQSALGTMLADGTGPFPIFIFAGSANPDWHPDGLTLLFDVNNISIWRYNKLTGNGLRLSNAGDSRPRYSPDASKIVFQSTRDGQSEIYVMNADGSEQTRLTNNSASDTAPAWSPDGTKILFTSLRDGTGNPALYVMNADGSNPVRVTAGSDGVWRTAPTPPMIFAEEGSNNAAAFYSVTYRRGPFRILDPHNFSLDGHARITLFTSSLGITSPPIPQKSTLSVQANGIDLPIENVGPLTGVTGLTGSYIIVRLPDGLPTGNLSLTMTLRGVTSEVRILPIVP
jgi:Tol biopolymer transport system component/subtilisin family serine protease